MGFFDSLFPNKPNVAEDKAFTTFFNRGFARYFSVTEPDFHADLDNNFGETELPQQAFPSVFEEWRKLSRHWDAQAALFSALDQHYLLVIEKWQAVERFLVDRFSEKALKFVDQVGQSEDFEDAAFLTSMARLMFVLSRYDEGLRYAEKAVRLDPGSARAQLALADLLHLDGDRQRAHSIYQKVVSDSRLAHPGTRDYGLYDLVCFRNDIVHSSVYAVGLLKSSEAPESEWEKVAPEFYHCPYFRSQHAFYLIQNKQAMKGLHALIETAKEFPTFKDAVVNAYNVVKQYQQQTTPEAMREDEFYLKGVMEKRNWMAS
ncbi:tetratricopeptide repeat protein [Flavobacterium selenitireducens]|uniref:tetratricopeptide repeat protein n=1 Tax=Flavobacterium selenitireducens TaxID=2722704 RepID=UPI00168AD348|nr:hypothetical protein [Flavobacterium selenitireducens]MBD3583417.1 hypothetical protein [Flavobacterium selenitireducens]